MNRIFWTLPGFAAGLLGMTLAAHAAPGATADLTIRVETLSPAGGILRLGLYDRTRYPDDNSKPVASADVKASGSEMVITLHGIVPGSYAIETFQDLNSNHKMDTSWFGFPLEPFGFSRDAQPHLSKPSFARVKFEVVPGLNVQTLHLQNSVSLTAAK
ncbi:MAG TPA: DUF2141 domain-containing protein [Rhizomicrobium sp.]|nr:DUF2141 domain-containing protein [Rhizomicrobium sp.]